MDCCACRWVSRRSRICGPTWRWPCSAPRARRRPEDRPAGSTFVSAQPLEVYATVAKGVLAMSIRSVMAVATRAGWLLAGTALAEPAGVAAPAEPAEPGVWQEHQ